LTNKACGLTFISLITSSNLTAS